MVLSELERGLTRYKVMLLQTPSDKLQMYIYDNVKQQLKCDKNTIIDIDNKSKIREVKDISAIDSMLSSRWLVTMSPSKSFNTDVKEILKIVRDSSTIFVFIQVDNYKQYKMVQKCIKDYNLTETSMLYYLSILRSSDFSYLYNKFTPKTNKLSNQLYDFVAKGYCADVPAVMDLFEALQSGSKFKTRADITELCGLGKNTVDNFVLSMLKPPPTTAKGFKTVLKNRLTAGLDLADSYGYSKFQSFVRSCLKAYIDIKVLSISGELYKKIANLPKGYDETKLLRYQRYVYRLQTIPLTKMLRLMYFLDMRVWRNDMDLLNFMYAYLIDSEKHEVILFMDKSKSSAEDEYIRQKKIEDEQAKQEAEEEHKFEVIRRRQLMQKYGIVKGREMYELEHSTGNVKSDMPNKSTKPSKLKQEPSNKEKDAVANLLKHLGRQD